MDTINFNLAVGVTSFHIAKDGIWYQEGFPHKITRNSPSAEFNVSTRPSGGNWEYSAGILYLGKVTSSAEAIRDEEYNIKTKKCDSIPISHCATVTYNGSGTVSGLTFAARRYYGSWFAEYGLILERSTWQVDMPNFTQYINGVEPRYHYHVEHKTKIQVLPTLAVGYKFKDSPLSLRVGVYPTAGHGDTFQPIYRGVSPKIDLSYRF